MFAIRRIIPIECLPADRPRPGRIFYISAMLVFFYWALAEIVTPVAHAQAVTLWPVAPNPDRPPVFTCRIVHVYPHDSSAFTQGLVFADGGFFEGTGLNGRSSLRRVTLETGRVDRIIPLPRRYFGEGVALSGHRVIQLTWKSHVGFVYDKETFAQMATFVWPREGWGLTEDGRQLIVSDGTDRLFFLDPSTFETQRVISVRDGKRAVWKLNELEFVEGYILANVWQTDRIAVIGPVTGRVAAWIRLGRLAEKQTRGVPNGIAYDRFRGRLFITGKQWPQLFEVALVPAP